MKPVKLTVNSGMAMIPIRGKLVRSPFTVEIKDETEFEQIKSLLRSYALDDYTISAVGREPEKKKNVTVKKAKDKSVKPPSNSTLDKLLDE